jgi:ribosomal protein L12E/L44/L45/RPP1/RPP2
LKIKLKGRHFDTIRVIEAESQAVLNTLKEHDIQDVFKKMAEALGMVHMCGSFDQMAAPVPEIMDGSLYV